MSQTKTENPETVPNVCHAMYPHRLNQEITRNNTQSTT